MKKYRLKKDLPFAKAGEIFQMGDGKRSGKNETSLTSEKVITTVLWVNDIINFDEWFEEVKEFEEWKPREGEKYKCTSSSGGIYTDSFLGCSPIDEFRISIGDAYPLDTPDEVIIKERVLIPQAMHRLRMAAKKAWFEYDGSEGPDWSGIAQSKYFIEYRHNLSCFDIDIESSYQVLGQIYFPTEKSAQAYIDNNQDDLELLFGVE